MAGEISDGYTEQGYISEAPRLYPALTFKYRPALNEELAELYERITKANTGKQAEQVNAKWLAERISSWTVEEKHFVQGGSRLYASDETITADSILRLRPRLYRRLRDIVQGVEASDEGPMVDLEADSKNSPSGSGSS